MIQTDGDKNAEGVWLCARCNAIIGDSSSAIAIPPARSAEQVLATPGGPVHVVTLLSATGVTITGTALTSLSPMQGYAWETTCCTTCGAHLGWRYTATRTQIDPEVFYGLNTEALQHELLQ